MPILNPRHPAFLLLPPRHPIRRARWWARLLGVGLGLVIAALAGLWLSEQVRPGGPFGLGLAPLGGAAPGLGLALGWLAAQPGHAGRLATWGARLMIASLPVLLVMLATTSDWWWLLAALGAGGLAIGSVDGPSWVLAGLLADAARQRRAWWSVALRAARLTRRTIGPGLYRQLSRDGSIRVTSGLYPGRVYRVPRRTSPSGARVLVEEHGQVIGGLCLRPRQPLPDPEEVVAHILLLRGDERAYLRAANFFPYDTALTPEATARRL